MKNILGLFSCIVAWYVLLLPAVTADVTFVPGDHRIDVIINGSAATTYLYTGNITKPVLYPLFTPQGIRMTRGWPLEDVEGETKDHPHHIGMFFTVDEVNDNKFWGNTEGLPLIRHIETVEMKGGNKSGVLSVFLHWTGGSGKTLLEERRTMTFIPGQGDYSVDFDISLTAVDTTVTFRDTKEGMFAVRTADWLREKGGTGKYISSRDGTSAAEIWGRRAEWVKLEGNKDGCVAGLVIMHHPSSVNFPTFWHARDYGLFSANPLGQSVFQEGTTVENPERFDLTLSPGKSALFRFRLLVYDGTRTKNDIVKVYTSYSSR